MKRKVKAMDWIVFFSVCAGTGGLAAVVVYKLIGLLGSRAIDSDCNATEPPQRQDDMKRNRRAVAVEAVGFYCGACQTLNPPKAKFYRGCGAELVEERE